MGATKEATEEFAANAVRGGVVREHFRRVADRACSSLGIGTYLGESDDETDAMYRDAIVRSAKSGVNLIDTAINYRCQRSERAVAAALEALDQDGFSREQFIIATKGGYIPFDGGPPANASNYLEERFYSRGIMTADDIVAGSHVMTPAYLRDQLQTSLLNLGLASIDIYYLHNPETQLSSVGNDEFRERVRAAFTLLEEVADEGKIAFYGTATWNGYRVAPGTTGHLSLSDLVSIAKEIAGDAHRFRFVQLPFNLGMTEAVSLPTQTVDGQSLSLLQAAELLGVYVIGSASMAQGQLTSGLPDWLSTLFKGLDSDSQRALQFARSAPGMTSSLVGMKSRAHVDENSSVPKVPPVAVEDFMKLFEVDER